MKFSYIKCVVSALFVVVFFSGCVSPTLISGGPYNPTHLNSRVMKGDIYYLPVSRVSLEVDIQTKTETSLIDNNHGESFDIDMSNLQKAADEVSSLCFKLNTERTTDIIPKPPFVDVLADQNQAFSLDVKPGWFSKSDISIEKYSNGLLKSVSASSEGQLDETIVSGVKAISSIAGANFGITAEEAAALSFDSDSSATSISSNNPHSCERWINILYVVQNTQEIINKYKVDGSIDTDKMTGVLLNSLNNYNPSKETTYSTTLISTYDCSDNDECKTTITNIANHVIELVSKFSRSKISDHLTPQQIYAIISNQKTANSFFTFTEKKIELETQENELHKKVKSIAQSASSTSHLELAAQKSMVRQLRKELAYYGELIARKTANVEFNGKKLGVALSTKKYGTTVTPNQIMSDAIFSEPKQLNSLNNIQITGSSNCFDWIKKNGKETLLSLDDETSSNKYQCTDNALNLDPEYYNQNFEIIKNINEFVFDKSNGDDDSTRASCFKDVDKRFTSANNCNRTLINTYKQPYFMFTKKLIVGNEGFTHKKYNDDLKRLGITQYCNDNYNGLSDGESINPACKDNIEDDSFSPYGSSVINYRRPTTYELKSYILTCNNTVNCSYKISGKSIVNLFNSSTLPSVIEYKTSSTANRRLDISFSQDGMLHKVRWKNSSAALAVANAANKSITGGIENFKQSLENIAAINMIENSIQLDELNKKILETEGELRLKEAEEKLHLGATSENLSLEIASLRTDLSNLQAEKDDLEARLDSSNVSIANNTTQLSTYNLASMKTSIDNLNSSLKTLQTKNSSMQKTIEALAKHDDLLSVNKALTAHKNKTVGSNGAHPGD